MHATVQFHDRYTRQLPAAATLFHGWFQIGVQDATHEVERSYDAVAAEYAARLYGELRHKPFDRELLDRFAGAVRPLGRCCDLGCGPGQIARYLHDRQVGMVGVDLSAGMLVQARHLNPDIEFVQASMLSLPFADGGLGSIGAFYSIIHIPRDDLLHCFNEMHRVLAPDGALLIAFHLGDADRHSDEWWGHQVSIDFYFFTVSEIEEHLVQAGFLIEEVLERQPYPEIEVETRRAYLRCRKGEGDASHPSRVSDHRVS
ncbi:MAG: class I SAM-dependent methyltransferase [Chloroflexota bacterium]